MWPFRKPSSETTALRDRAIIAESQVVFLMDMLRPKREVRKDASRYSKAKKEKTAALCRLHPDVAERHGLVTEDGFAKAVRLGAWDGLKLGKGTP
jgi:hypothetical protein